MFLVSESIPVSITGCLKRVLGSQDISAHTVTIKMEEWEDQHRLIQINQHLSSLAKQQYWNFIHIIMISIK